MARLQLPGDGIGREVVDEGTACSTLQPDMGWSGSISARTVPRSDHARGAHGATSSTLFARWATRGFEQRAPGHPSRRASTGLVHQPATHQALPFAVLPDQDKGPKDSTSVFRRTWGGFHGRRGQFADTPDEVAIEAEMNTRKGVERIIRAAFEYADQHGKDRVCMSDKSNAMRHGHDLWQRTFKAVAAEYPAITASHLYVDVLAMELVRCPEQFQVVVTNNLFGDIITDLGAILQGGIGLAGSGNINPGKVSLFEPVHGSAPTIAGQGVANPLAAILTVAMMLEYLGHTEDAARVNAAVAHCLTNDLITPELGGSLSTKEVGDAVLAQL